MKKIIFFILCVTALHANAQITDTTKKKVVDTIKKDLFTAPDTVKHLHSKTGALIPPIAMVGYGVSSLVIHPLHRFDGYLYGQADRHDIVTPTKLENFFQFTPVVLTYGLNFVGVHGKNTFIDRTFIFVLAQFMLEGSTFAIKHATHRLRPDNSDYLSFPSGHTGNAFVGAEFMSQELGKVSPVYSAIGYSFATTTGIFRIYHKDHWFSDVIAGAGFGILSTKAAYWVYPIIRNRLTKKGREKEEDKKQDKEIQKDLKKKPEKSSIILPSYQNGAWGLQFAAQF
ncbi:phosphatase PAP2 family protein [Mucilaginibacter boryungensis]|uniref:Phosphatase PAP2 family protein n=1 Tax=Mucilaginibacter boryungensis TaxID=768480 RepID=A0ABR9XF80_9SPHI|nr:phosphatase PAP2 family protein [Mucilaginibacter boryungensis]MBE9666048.1 phosphatase PAP2 family protein [Mucilaginibacter boryungensis]